MKRNFKGCTLDPTSTVMGRLNVKLAWLTDLHLDLVDEDRINDLFGSLSHMGADCILVGGDIGRSESLTDRLLNLAEQVHRPVYFVLGNHDIYGSSIAHVRQTAIELSHQFPHLHFLPGKGVVPLTQTTALIGHGLWGDGRAGKASKSPMELADHHLIEDFAGLDRPQLFARLNDLGDQAATWIRKVLPAALGQAQDVVFLTHAPPFAGPVRNLERASSPDALPFYICSAAGTAILDIMAEHPDQQLTLLSGHRHVESEFQPAPNIHAIAGGAKYMHPKVQRVLDVR